MENNNNFAILICSCQAYSDLWSNQYYLLNKYWPNHPKTYLVSDGEGIYNLKRVDNMFVCEGESPNRIINAINNIKEEYVFIVFDDYYLVDNVNQKALDELLQYIISNHYDYCGFYRNRKKGKKRIKGTNLARLPLNNPYEINFFLSLWKKDSLLKCLVKDENIWQTEAKLTKRANSNSLNACCSLDRRIIPFMDVVVQGKYRRGAYRYLFRNEFFISNRKKMNFNETLKSNIKPFISKTMPLFIKNFIKNKYRKKGKIFYSDC